MCVCVCVCDIFDNFVSGIKKIHGKIIHFRNDCTVSVTMNVTNSEIVIVHSDNII